MICCKKAFLLWRTLQHWIVFVCALLFLLLWNNPPAKRANILIVPASILAVITVGCGSCRYEHLFSQWGGWVLGREGGNPTEIKWTHLVDSHCDQCPIGICFDLLSPSKMGGGQSRQTIKVWTRSFGHKSRIDCHCQHQNSILLYIIWNFQREIPLLHVTSIENIDLALLFAQSWSE